MTLPVIVLLIGCLWGLGAAVIDLIEGRRIDAMLKELHK